MNQQKNNFEELRKSLIDDLNQTIAKYQTILEELEKGRMPN